MTNAEKTAVEPTTGLPPDPINEPGRARLFIVNYGVVVFLLLLIIGFSVALPDLFPTIGNVQVILGGQAIGALLALAVILPLAAGEFDLSAGATLGFCAVISAYLSASGQSVLVTLAVTMFVALLIGAINGFIVTVIGVGAFIATLGMATILAGGNLLITNGTLITDVPRSMTVIGQSTVAGIPVLVFYVIALALLLYYLLEWTPAGRYFRATGSGREAARLTGIRTQRWLFASFVIAAVIAGLAGFLLTARLGTASPTVGPEFLLPAYAAAFLGATTIKPGRFNVWGTMVGVLVLAVGISGLNLGGAPFWVPQVFNGGALLLAVSVSVWVAKQKKAAASSV